MHNDWNIAKQAIHNKFESQSKTVEAKVDALKVGGGLERERRDETHRSPAAQEARDSTEAAGTEEIER